MAQTVIEKKNELWYRLHGLTERCLRLIQSPEMAIKMGQTARARVERDFSAEDMAHRVALLYKELIESGSGE